MSHPYYPPDAQVHGYAANESSLPALLITASVACVVLLSSTWVLLSVLRPSLCRSDKIAVLWFVLSGLLHCCFEGYFVMNHDRMASSQDVLAQLWKEYALSDSRYLTEDTLVLCLETMTVFLWGPMCLLVATSIVAKHALRHPLQIIVCTCHLYGDALYYLTSLFDHYVKKRPYCRPEAYYFWLYYVLMNFVWIIVPAFYLINSMMVTSNAFQRLAQVSPKRKPL